jgi:hypothetical protein
MLTGYLTHGCYQFVRIQLYLRRSIDGSSEGIAQALEEPAGVIREVRRSLEPEVLSDGWRGLARGLAALLA